MKQVEAPTVEQYQRAEIQVYRMFAPAVLECGNCGWPYPKGYVCNTCGCDNSEGEDE